MFLATLSPVSATMSLVWTGLGIASKVAIENAIKGTVVTEGRVKYSIPHLRYVYLPAVSLSGYDFS